MAVYPKFRASSVVFRKRGGNRLCREEFAHLGGVSLEVFSGHSKMLEQLTDGRIRNIASLVRLVHSWLSFLVVVAVVVKKMKEGKRKNREAK